MRRIFAGALAVILSAVIATPTLAVVSGSEVIDAATSKPWVASIWFAENEDSLTDPQYLCTGSLIQQDIVLTAAHCILDTGFYFVRLQSDTLSSSSPMIQVSSTWKNPRYTSTKFVNDIGLLMLAKPVLVPTMPYVKATQSAALSKVKNFEIYGWGSNQDEQLATYLRKAKLSLQTTAAKKIYGSKYFNATTMIAAGTYIKNERIYSGGCRGDSGGPLVAKINGIETIVGVTSWGSRNCNLSRPTVFTKLSYYSKDVELGLATVRKSAVSSNRIPIENISPPRVSGSYLAGGVVTCDTGTWSSNVTSVTVRWTSPYEVYGSTNKTIAVRNPSLYGTTYTCVVTAKSAYSSVSVTAASTFYAPPVVSSAPLILGLYNGVQTAIGTQGRCSSYFYGTITSTTYEWFLSSTANYVAATAQSVGSGASLTITEDIRVRATSGENYLHCVATAANSSGSTSSSSSVALAFAFVSNSER
ncbi:S1 family peptidase [Rhodoluna limnophila]|uniref:S1 family peptidase n=1 Tax=Rhodoluna limnophila TaxID=232537 RepID=UPI00110746B2|nr:serine protease [Rhodoluna limnophila]